MPAHSGRGPERPAGIDGRIAGEPARVWRGEDGYLRLDWRGRRFDLGREVVRHRDVRRRIEFGVGGASVRYRRRGPRPDPLGWFEDEPWTWEDSDFGLFVFHLATSTGPLKYRHLVTPPPAPKLPSHRGLQVDEQGVRRSLPGMRSQRVAWGELAEVRAKFKFAGIWEEPTLLVLHTPGDLVVVPVGHRDDVTWVRRSLLPWLRRLPAWDDVPLERAIRYAESDAIGPLRGERPVDWAERGIWSRAGG